MITLTFLVQWASFIATCWLVHSHDLFTTNCQSWKTSLQKKARIPSCSSLIHSQKLNNILTLKQHAYHTHDLRWLFSSHFKALCNSQRNFAVQVCMHLLIWRHHDQPNHTTTPCPFTGATVRFQCFAHGRPTGGAGTEGACASINPMASFTPFDVHYTVVTSDCFSSLWDSICWQYHYVTLRPRVRCNFKTNTRIFIKLCTKTRVSPRGDPGGKKAVPLQPK